MIYLRNKNLLLVVLGVLSLAYPFIVYYFADILSPSYLVLGIISLLLLRALLLWSEKQKLQRATKNTIYLTLLVVIAMLGLYFWNSMLAPFFYPVVVSLGLALLMGFTLIYPPSMIERFARIAEPDLDERGVRYTRKVTIAWMLFGFINAAIALITVLIGDRAVWTLYNGFISYVLVGLLMGVEYVVRRCVRRR